MTTAGIFPPPYTPPAQTCPSGCSLDPRNGVPGERYGESQQPSADSQPSVDALPVKSFSSVTMKIAVRPDLQAGVAVIVSTAVFTKASAFCFSAASFASSLAEPYGHGVPSLPSGGRLGNTPPGMSWHRVWRVPTKAGIGRGP